MCLGVLERCKEGAATFDSTKLTWMNGLYIRRKKPEELVSLSLSYLKEKGFVTGPDKSGHYSSCSIHGAKLREYLKKIISLERERIKKLSEVPDLIEYFLVEKIKFDSEAVEKVLKRPEVKEILTSLKQRLEDLIDFSAGSLEKTIRNWTKNKDLKTKDVFHPLRVAITGRTVGPGLFETMEVLGKERVLKRIREAINENVG